MNHALQPALPYLRSISRAMTQFLDEQNSKMTISHMRTGILVPCMKLFVMTLN